VPDGSIYSVGNVTIPGRNFNGYGSPVDQNMLSMIENFASTVTGPSQPVTGQLWYDASVQTLKFNTSSNAIAQWATVPKIDPSGNATFGNLSLTGNLVVAAPGVIYGNGSGIHSLNASNLSTGTIPAARLSGTYNIDVTGNIQTANITTGLSTTPGTITGNWTLTAGSRLQATYADLAERHHSDREYSVGTVMTVGGENEVTAASVGNKVLGVISNAYAYLMNSTVGDDTTHPPVAYVGRVPVRITGPINKHDVIVDTLDGCARAGFATEGFGWALETNTEAGEKLVLCIIK
jgi:hypothetical protein